MLLVVISSALTVALIVMLVANALPARSPGVKARMAELELDGMFAADAAAKRYRPGIAGIGVPIGNDDDVRNQIPALGKIIV